MSLLFLNGLIYSSPFVLFMILAFHVPFFFFLFSLSTSEHKTFFHPNDQPIIVPSDVLQRHPQGCPPKKEFKKKKKRMKKLKCIHEVYYSSVFLALSFQYYKLSMNLLGSNSVPQILGAFNQLIKDECLTFSLLEMLPLAH